MERKTAAKIVESTVSLNDKIGDVDLAISEVIDENEKSQFVTALGNILGIIRKDILVPILKEYPDLNPYKK